MMTGTHSKFSDAEEEGRERAPVAEEAERRGFIFTFGLAGTWFCM